jgi:hypothetical protein
MPILYSQITSLIGSALDAEDSQRYTDNEDYIPAINYAIDYVTLAFNSIFSQKKLSEEVLQELSYVKVWQASLLSRIAFDPAIVRMNLWTINAVYPKCQIIGKLPFLPATNESVYLPGTSFVDGKYVAKRLTLEEWTEKNSNVFSAGNANILAPDLIEYGYINFANYTGGYTLVHDPFEIGISPNVAGDAVAIAFLKMPTKIVTVTPTTTIEFPDVLTNLIFQTALSFIAIKQNQKTSVAQLSTMAVQEIIKLLS